MQLTRMSINGSNMIEKVPVDADPYACPNTPDWNGPFYLFERVGQDDRFLDIYIGQAETMEEFAKLKKDNLYRCRYWNEEFRMYSEILWFVREAIEARI